jgi:subfamily B ATP-binding cassette protein MsbA
MSGRQLCRRLMRYIAPNWEVLAFALAGLIMMAATVPMLAALLRPMLDGAIVDKNRELMQLVLMGLITLFAVRGAAGHISTYAINWVGSKLASDLRVDMFDKLLSLPGRYYASHSTGSLIFRITSDTRQVARTFIAVGTIVGRDTFTIVGLLGWAFYLDWQLSMLALALTALVLMIIRMVAIKLQKMGTEIGQSVDSGIASVVKESIENYAAIKLYGGQQYESRRIREQTAGVHRFTMKRVAIAALGVPLIQMATAVAFAAIIYFAAQQSFADEITAGGFISLIAALIMLIAPVKRVAGIKAALQPGLIAGRSIFSLLDEQPEPEAGTVAIERARGELRFEQVSFCPALGGFESDSKSGFEACPALPDIMLQNVNLTVHPGEMVALVGFQTGSAAALANLVPLFFHPASGRILLDGCDLQSISLASLRANIALISADAELFNDTIAANIAYGDMRCATEVRIMSAAYAAHVSEFVRQMPEGLQTPVGTQGLKLSPGQRFRIAIARALLKNSPVLIVNEISERLDSGTAHHVDAALEAVTRERTTLIITHRLSTVKKADRVVLLHKGGVAAVGTHRELLTKDETYARLARTFI